MSLQFVSLTSLFEPLILALSILILFFKKGALLDLDSIYLLINCLKACFLKKNNLTFLYSIYLFSFYLLYN